MDSKQSVRLFVGIVFSFAAIVFVFVPGMYSALADDSTATTTAAVATSTDGTGGEASNTGGTIETGDATASTTIDNTANHSEVFPDAPNEEMNSSNLTSTSTNDALVISGATSTAATGDNTIEGGEGTNLIVTGNAVSTANVINEVNTNIFNSDGLILFLNQMFGGGLDLTEYDLEYFFAGGPGASPTTDANGQSQCTLLTCLNSSSLNVFNQNDAVVSNSVIVRASTGDNTATSTEDAEIDTGDAYAAANVVNLVNTNIINSSYLLIAFNQFGDLVENVTLPGAAFFDKLFASGYASSTMNSSTYTVDNTNDVTLTGTTTASATTGDNVASTTLDIATSTDPFATTTDPGTAEVTTGNAFSSSQTFNQANTTGIGGTAVFLMFRVAGDWTGEVVGIPDGLVEDRKLIGGDTIVTFVSRGATSTPAGELLQEYNSSHFLAQATSTASVENNVDVSASTGGNSAQTESGTASINTGNAYSSASVVNLINTNIVGQNWIFGVFNVFGNMSGDIVFGGSPLLSISGSVSPTNAAPGDTVTYTFTVTNAGNGSARNVALQTSFDNTLLTFEDARVVGTTTTTGQSWDLGLISQGKSRTFSFTARVGSNFPAGQTANVPLTAVAVNDVMTSPIPSNTASVNLTVSSPGGGSSGGGGGGGGSSSSRRNNASTRSAENSSITIKKTATASSTPGYVDYQVKVYNKKSEGAAYGAALTDTLYNPAGEVMFTRGWQLGTVAPGDEITLTYTVSFATTTEPGVYRNVAEITGRNKSPSGGKVSVKGEASITLGTQGSVLGAATSTIQMATSSPVVGCSGPYLSTYLQSGVQGNEVVKLQVFLNVFQGAGLPTTGFFGPMTSAAVSQFQSAYAQDILAPLGLTAPTGSVYARTQEKINSLMCGT
ncbi:DUF11 domain-containing protein [Candidatus Parcubacteria bacterium]|nr:MAG: DUF11 domain-containing protein [Candidatus Parcubacteria bacterium]